MSVCLCFLFRVFAPESSSIRRQNFFQHNIVFPAIVKIVFVHHAVLFFYQQSGKEVSDVNETRLQMGGFDPFREILI